MAENSRDDESSTLEEDDELIQEVYAYVDSNPVGVHLTLSEEGNILKVSRLLQSINCKS